MHSPPRFSSLVSVAFAVALCVSYGAGCTNSSGDNLSQKYNDVAQQIIDEAMTSNIAYDNLGYLCDNIGHRLSGSPQLERAIDWAIATMNAQGLENVRAEPVMVPRWIRGMERGWLSAPTYQRLNVLGLGRSVGTPPGGIRADVVVVGSFDELEALGRQNVEGRIVLYDVPYDGYGKTVKYRGEGASRAARLGAVAALVRSVGPMSFDTPHTGSLRYSEEDPRIPAAAVTIENSTMMRRMQERGDRIVAHLEMGAHNAGEVMSANVVAEWVGSELPDEVVVLGGHFDSWDVGQGAQDNGAGCLIAWEAVHTIKRLGLRPRRTLRVVLWTNEENGLKGATAYRDAHLDELKDHVAAIESDLGNGRADGFRLDIRGFPVEESEAAKEAADATALPYREASLAMLQDAGGLLADIGGDHMQISFSGADLGPLAKEGVACLGLNHDYSEYFKIHHTRADTFDRIVKEDLNHNVAVMAVMAYVLADMPGRLEVVTNNGAPTSN